MTYLLSYALGLPGLRHAPSRRLPNILRFVLHFCPPSYIPPFFFTVCFFKPATVGAPRSVMNGGLYRYGISSSPVIDMPLLCRDPSVFSLFPGPAQTYPDPFLDSRISPFCFPPFFTTLYLLSGRTNPDSGEFSWLFAPFSFPRPVSSPVRGSASNPFPLMATFELPEAKFRLLFSLQ